jgi:HTH-type transcriptional regulator / antitoxin HigA
MEESLHIDNEKQYERALARLFRLMHKKLTKNSPEKKELKILSRLVEAYERKFYPIISAL